MIACQRAPEFDRALVESSDDGWCYCGRVGGCVASWTARDARCGLTTCRIVAARRVVTACGVVAGRDIVTTCGIVTARRHRIREPRHSRVWHRSPVQEHATGGSCAVRSLDRKHLFLCDRSGINRRSLLRRRSLLCRGCFFGCGASSAAGASSAGGAWSGPGASSTGDAASGAASYGDAVSAGGPAFGSGIA